MRFGLPISIMLHLALLVWATVTIGSAKPPVTPEPIPINVAMLTEAEFSNIRKGSETSKEKTTATKPKDAEPADTPPVKAKRKAEAVPPKAEPEPPKPEPPKPEPPKPEPPKPEPPMPEPPKPEPAKSAEPPKLDRIAEQLSKPDPPKKPEPPKLDPIAEQLKKVAALDPPVKKEPPKPVKKAEPDKATAPAKAPKKKGLDISKLQAQINQLPDAAPDSGSDATPDPEAKTTAAAIGVKKPTGTQLSATELQMFLGIFSSKVNGCWTVLAGASDARDLVVPVHFELGPDGRLKSEPVVTGGSASPQFALAAENVVRAIRQCEPYALPPDQYAKWQTWDIDFDPRAMFGG